MMSVSIFVSRKVFNYIKDFYTLNNVSYEDSLLLKRYHKGKGFFNLEFDEFLTSPQDQESLEYLLCELKMKDIRFYYDCALLKDNSQELLQDYESIKASFDKLKKDKTDVDLSVIEFIKTINDKDDTINKLTLEISDLNQKNNTLFNKSQSKRIKYSISLRDKNVIIDTMSKKIDSLINQNIELRDSHLKELVNKNRQITKLEDELKKIEEDTLNDLNRRIELLEKTNKMAASTISFLYLKIDELEDELNKSKESYNKEFTEERNNKIHMANQLIDLCKKYECESK